VTGIFKERTSGAVFLLILTSIGLHVNFIYDPPGIITNAGQGLLTNFLSSLPQVPSVGLMLVYQLFIITQALRLNYIVNDNRMLQKQGFSVSLAYILVTAILPEWNNITPALLINTLLIELLAMCAKLYQNKSVKSLVFGIGLMSGIITLLHFASFSVILISFCALAILRAFKANEWFVLLLGIITPVYITAALLYITDKWHNLATLHLFDIHSFNNLDHFYGVITALSLLIVLLIAGLIYWNNNSGRMLIHARKVWSVLLFSLIILIPLPFFTTGSTLEGFLPLMIPVAAIGSNFFSYSRTSWLPNLFFWLFVAAVIFINAYWIIVKA